MAWTRRPALADRVAPPSLSAGPEPRSVVLAMGAVMGLALLPFFLRNFVVFQLTMVLVYAIAILGLNLLTGLSGQFSLGHGAFYALGAYSAAILIEHAGLSYVAAIPIAGFICFGAGLAFGLPARRLQGAYLALATFALAVATPPLLKLTALERWTGGVQGLTVTRPDPPFGLPLTQDQWLYLVTLGLAAGLAIAAANLVSSRSGRALLAIRDQPIAACAVGIDVARDKALIFGLSALYAGVAGSLGALAIQFVAPDSFTFSLSVAFFVGLVVGGVGWLPGALPGAAFIVFVPNLAEHLSKGLSGAIYGVILLIIVIFMPGGIGGLIGALWERWRRG